MKNYKFLKIAALIFPILVITGFASQEFIYRIIGDEVILDISGYDPRDLLRGHYISYTIAESTDNIKTDVYFTSDDYYSVNGYLILVDSNNDGVYDSFSEFSESKPSNPYIKGTIHDGYSGIYYRITDNIKRYYVNEKLAPIIESAITKADSVQIKGTVYNGEFRADSLIIDGTEY